MTPTRQQTNGRQLTYVVVTNVLSTLALVLGLFIGGFQLAQWKGEITTRMDTLAMLVEQGLKTATTDRQGILSRVASLEVWRASRPQEVMGTSNVLERIERLDKRIDHLEEYHMRKHGGSETTP